MEFDTSPNFIQCLQKYCGKATLLWAILLLLLLPAPAVVGQTDMAALLITKNTADFVITTHNTPKPYSAFFATAIPYSLSSGRQTQQVYICLSENAYAYHNHVCSGLSRCRHDIIKVSVYEAQSRGYRACKICY